MNINDYKKIFLPDEPGVYLFKKNDAILYIGKATSLKDRVKSYFSNDLIANRGPLIVDMVFQSENVEFIKTDSVLEALILESNLIKKYQPKYNTKEKDDRSYNYVVITKEEFPRVLTIRGRELADGKRSNLWNSKRFDLEEPVYQSTFGPFTNGTQLKEALKIIRKIFPFLDKYSNKKNGYNFYRQINLAPDITDLQAKNNYKKNIKSIKLFFEGKKQNIIKNLEREMKGLAKKQEFEKANELKKTIFALNHIQDVALIKEDGFSGKRSNLGNSERFDLEGRKVFRIEAYDIAHISGTNTVGVMTVVENGVVNKTEYRKFKINESVQNDTAGLAEILKRRLSHSEWKFPDIVVVDGGIAQKNIAEKIINEFKKLFGSETSKLVVVAVTKDEKHRPKMIMGREDTIRQYKSEILLANSEAHRFAIKYHRELRNKIFKL